MIAASVWSLLLPGIDFAEANGQVGWLVMTGGFLLGVITLLVADGLMKAWYEREKSTQLTLGKSTAMLIICKIRRCCQVRLHWRSELEFRIFQKGRQLHCHL